ncbi:Cna B-type domain-containing protein [Streptococcaceae bacterium ESL0687]|nr:Cna B-type domain-containing protein [Streptococcaceae bacterium ESL0687]
MNKINYLLKFFILLGVFLLTPLSTFAQADAPSTKQINNIVTNAKLSSISGQSIDQVTQYSIFYLGLDFKLPNGQVNEGDTSVITLPDELTFSQLLNFDIKNANGDVVAKGVADPASKKLTLTYTSFAATHYDVSGKIQLAVKIDNNVVTEYKPYQLNLDIENSSFPLGVVTYGASSGDDPKENFLKYHWVSDDDTNEISYIIRVNAVGGKINQALVTDELQTAGMSYEKDSFKIRKGNFFIGGNGGFQLADPVDVTSQTAINYYPDSSGFSINLGNITQGYEIYYRVRLNHTPLNNEIFTNYAKLNGADSELIKQGTSTVVWQTASGEAYGYNYTINIHKTDDSGNPLKGAEFSIVRSSSGATVATVTSDENGNASISGLLRDNYVITETKAPDDYELNSNPTTVTPQDFGSDNEVTKNIINNKISKIKITGRKTWDDDNNKDGLRPDKITVHLLANGQTVQSTPVSADTDWEYEFTNLPEYKDGQKINYTVTEDSVDGYTTTINGFDITNSHTPKKTNSTATKNNDDGTTQVNPLTKEATNSNQTNQPEKKKTPVKAELPNTGIQKENNFKLIGILLLLTTTSMIFAYKKFIRVD